MVDFPHSHLEEIPSPESQEYLLPEGLEESLREFQSGEREAFPKIYYACLPLVINVIRSMGIFHQHDQDDIVQDVFLIAYLKAHTVRDPHALIAWFKQVTVHMVIDSLRARAKEHALPLMDTADDFLPSKSFDPVRVCLQRECESRLHEHMAHMHIGYQEALQDQFVDDLRQEDAAVKRGVPVGTIKTRRMRAIDSLRYQLQFDPFFSND